MKAMILAAGRGERMRPLTDVTPKPLLEAGGKPLVVWQIEALRAAGITELVINLGHLGERIRSALDDGRALGVRIEYSPEPPGALETGGGIRQALPLLGPEPFVAVNADIWTDFDYGRLPRDPAGLAHLVLVDNPPHHPQGDFVLREGRVFTDGGPRLCFSGIGVYRPELFRDTAEGRFPLAPLLRRAMEAGQVRGERHGGLWSDVGTPERLAELDRRLREGVWARK